MCSTFHECVCEDNCAGEDWSAPEPAQHWLALPKNSEQRQELLNSPFCSYLQWLAQQDASAWLLSGSAPVETTLNKEALPVFQFFESLARESNSRWLLGKEESSQTQDSDGSMKWLLCADETDVKSETKNIHDAGSGSSAVLLTSPEFVSIHKDRLSVHDWLLPSEGGTNCESVLMKWLLKGKDLNDDRLKAEELIGKFRSFNIKNDTDVWLSTPAKDDAHYEKANEMPEYADSENGKEASCDELFQHMKNGLANVCFNDWLMQEV